MIGTAIRVHEGLIGAGRLPPISRIGQRVSAIELATLMLMGMLATLATAFIDLHLRMPGQSIIHAVFPMAFGMAIVPRRLGGSIMGASALVTLAGLRVGGFTGIGAGAITSLFLTGPMLDLALRSACGGWRLYLGFVLAGLSSNLAALAARGAAKAISGGLSGGRPLGDWWSAAMWTYPLCGVIAGLISALAWFHFAAARRQKDSVENMR